jgi:hypothetical protein
MHRGYQQAERHSIRDTSRETDTVAGVAVGRRNSSGDTGRQRDTVSGILVGRQTQ